MQHALAARSPWKYARSICDQILTGGDGPNVNMIASVRRWDTGEELCQVGGIWSRYLGQYIPGDDQEPAKVWTLNRGQIELFQLLPKILDRSIEIPVTEVISYGGRRSGKTEGAVLLALSLSLIFPCSVGALYGYDYESALNSLDKIMNLVPESWVLNYNKQTKVLQFANQSEIRFKTAKAGKRAGRSFAFSWIILDEPSFYDNTQQIINGVLPATLEQNGPVLMITSPNGRDPVFWETEKSKDPDPEISKSIVTIRFGSTFDNPFLSAKALKKIKVLSKTMSKSDYQQEILGQPSNIDGLVLYDWNREIHVRDLEDLDADDITAPVCRDLFKVDADFIVGMDFNESPMAATIWKLLSDGHLHCLASIQAHNMNAQKFGKEMLLPWLKEHCPDVPENELAKRCVVIGDATGNWQGVGARHYQQTTSFDFLRSLGFLVVPPALNPIKSRVVKHGTRRNNKQSGYQGVNPRKAERMESVRTRLYNVSGEAFISVEKGCIDVIKMAENLQLYNGLPDKLSEYEHLWDAWSYVVYKFFPRKTINETTGNEGWISMVERSIRKHTVASGQ